jgi:hypothetical protein
MSYHNISHQEIHTERQTVNAQSQTAPAGYHYMPDGTLMSNAVMAPNKVIKNFDLDLSDLLHTSELRQFTISGDNGAQFILEIRNEDTYYYNFTTKEFQAAPSRLEKTITGGTYRGSITFPTVTPGVYSNTAARNDKITGTVNGTVTASTTVVLDQTIESLGINVGDRVTGNTALDEAIVYVATIPSANTFTLSTAVNISNNTVLSFYSHQYDIYLYAVPGTMHSPYQEVRFGDGSLDINNSKGSTSLMMRKVIYQNAPIELTISGYSPGSVISGVNTNTVISTGRGRYKVKTPFSYVFTANAGSGYAVRVLKQPSSSDVLAFVQPVVGANPVPIPGEDVTVGAYRWPIDNFADKIKAGMIVLTGVNVTAGTVVGDYYDTVTTLENTENENVIVKNKIQAVDAKAQKPTMVKGLVTVQPGNITFSKQQVLALAGDTLKIGGYGEHEILRVYGWDIRFTDLKVTLTAPTTTTSGVVTGNAIIGVNNVEGVIDNVSRVGGIGINPALQNPLITGGGGTTGSGNWEADATQTLENGITLTVENTGKIATITGNIEILKAGTASQTLRFDLGKFLSDTA